MKSNSSSTIIFHHLFIWDEKRRTNDWAGRNVKPREETKEGYGYCLIIKARNVYIRHHESHSSPLKRNTWFGRVSLSYFPLLFIFFFLLFHFSFLFFASSSFFTRWRRVGVFSSIIYPDSLGTYPLLRCRNPLTMKYGWKIIQLVHLVSFLICVASFDIAECNSIQDIFYQFHSIVSKFGS